MGAFLDYIFNNSHYEEVQQTYKQVCTPTLQYAFNVWLEHKRIPSKVNYAFKEYIFEHIKEIKTVHNWIGVAFDLCSNMREAVEWLYSEKRGVTSIPEMSYGEYEFIVSNKSLIETYGKYKSTYSRLLLANREAVLWLYSDSFEITNIPPCNYREIEFVATNETKIQKYQKWLSESSRIIKNYSKASERLINKELASLTFSDKKRIATSENRIKEIDKELKRIEKLKNTYPLAWQFFSHGKSWESLSLTKLESADEKNFKIKDEFLKHWEENPELIKLILGVKRHPVNSFLQETIDKEQFVLDYMNSRRIGTPRTFSKDVHLDNSDKLKRAIMDSTYYGNKCNFPEEYTITDFYSLRENFDKIGITFDKAIEKVNDNMSAIFAFNKEKTGKDKTYYTDDYLAVVTEGQPLYEYVEQYKEKKEKRDKAKNIQRNYSLGFNTIYGNINLDDCPLSDIINIIHNERNIRCKNDKLEALERRRREEEEKRREISNLKSCVSNWLQPNRSTANCFSLYNYYPTTCDWNASEEEWDIRRLIWDFKANPNKPQSEYEIQERHEQALSRLLPNLEKVINHYFGNKKTKLTLVCIPSSKRIVTERRYKDLAQKLCSITGMSNGYAYVSVTNDGQAKHLGGTSEAEFSIDSNYFKDRYVLLFDDVITTGKSMELFKRILESVGAIVIGGLSIGKTKHERQFSNPIDLL